MKVCEKQTTTGKDRHEVAKQSNRHAPSDCESSVGEVSAACSVLMHRRPFETLSLDLDLTLLQQHLSTLQQRPYIQMDPKSINGDATAKV